MQMTRFIVGALAAAAFVAPVIPPATTTGPATFTILPCLPWLIINTFRWLADE